jgi:hypothetical protein
VATFGWRTTRYTPRSTFRILDSPGRIELPRCSFAGCRLSVLATARWSGRRGSNPLALLRLFGRQVIHRGSAPAKLVYPEEVESPSLSNRLSVLATGRRVDGGHRQTLTVFS